MPAMTPAGVRGGGGGLLRSVRGGFGAEYGLRREEEGAARRDEDGRWREVRLLLLLVLCRLLELPEGKSSGGDKGRLDVSCRGVDLGIGGREEEERAKYYIYARVPWS